MGAEGSILLWASCFLTCSEAGTACLGDMVKTPQAAGSPLTPTTAAWTVMQKIHQPRPVTLTVFGERVFAGSTKLGISRWDHPGLSWAPHQ